MAKVPCEKLAETYLNWLREAISAAPVLDGCEITTPFLDRHNDHIQIYASARDGGLIFSDDGQVFADLEFPHGHRSPEIDEIVRGFGVRRQDSKLVIESSDGQIGPAIHALIQAVVATNYALATPQPQEAKLYAPQGSGVTTFRGDVKGYLDENRVSYQAKRLLVGRSGLEHKIDFLIPTSQSRPERLLQVITTPRKDVVEKNIFALTDIRHARNGQSEAFAFLNNRDREVRTDVLNAFKRYTVKPIRWTERAEYLVLLTG